MGLSKKLDAYYRLGMSTEDKEKLYDICNDSYTVDGIAKNINKEKSRKNSSFDKLIKIAIGGVAIVATFAIVVGGVKNFGIRSNKKNVTKSNKEIGIPDGFTTYTIKVIGTDANGYAKPEVGKFMDYWLVNETFDVLKAECQADKTKKEILNEISYKKLAKLKILKVSEPEWDTSNLEYDDPSNRYNLFYEIKRMREEGSSREVLNALEGTSFGSVTSYNVTLLVKKSDLKKIKVNESEYGELKYFDYVLDNKGSFHDEAYDNYLGKVSKGCVPFTIQFGVIGDVKKDDMVDLIYRDLESTEIIYKVENVKILSRSNEPSSYVDYSDVTVEIKEEIAKELIELEEKQEKPFVCEFEKITE